MANSNAILNKALCLTAMSLVLIGTVATRAAQAQLATTLRDPLIQGAIETAPQGVAPTPLPPPPGDGPTPLPVTPGIGTPNYEPWVTNIPADTYGISSSAVSLPANPSTTAAPGQLAQQVGGSIPPPPSISSTSLPMVTPDNAGYNPPASIVPINPQGGLGADTAPTQKWGGQTTRYFITPVFQGSTVTDFGQPLTQKPDLAKTPAESQDGPRPMVPLTSSLTVRRLPQLPGAQQTTDTGFRVQFKPQQQLQTIVPY